MFPSQSVPPCINPQDIVSQFGGDTTQALGWVVNYMNTQLIPVIVDMRVQLSGNIDGANIQDGAIKAKHFNIDDFRFMLGQMGVGGEGVTDTVDVVTNVSYSTISHLFEQAVKTLTFNSGSLADISAATISTIATAEECD